MAKVIRTHDSAPFDPLLAVACAVNGGLWMAYGFAIADPFI